jgi:hypothetical protein
MTQPDPRPEVLTAATLDDIAFLDIAGLTVDERQHLATFLGRMALHPSLTEAVASELRRAQACVRLTLPDGQRHADMRRRLDAALDQPKRSHIRPST